MAHWNTCRTFEWWFLPQKEIRKRSLVEFPVFHSLLFETGVTDENPIKLWWNTFRPPSRTTVKDYIQTTIKEYNQTTTKDYHQRLYSDHHQGIYSNHHQRAPSQRQTFIKTELEVERKHFPSKCALHLFEIWSWWQSDDGVKYNCFHFSSVGYLYIFHVCIFQIRRVPLPPLFEIGSRLEMIIASTMN